MRPWLIACCLVQSVALAQVPAKIGYQGRLLNADGTPATGVVPMTFSLFPSATGGTACWTEVQQVALTDGYYAVVLGDIAAFSPSMFNGTELFLEVSIGGTAMIPRQRVDSVAYSVVAGTAHDLSGGAVNASSISVGGNPVINSSGKWVGSALVAHDSTLVGDGSATPLGIDPTQVQLRVSQGCPAGSFLTSVSQSGAVVCGTPPGGSGGGSIDLVTGAGLTGGPITSSGTISVASGGITNTMLANPSLTISAGSGLVGGGAVPLGGTVTLGTSCGGDLSGSLSAASVVKLNGVPVAAASPAANDVLTFNGATNQWAPAPPSAGGITGTLGTGNGGTGISSAPSAAGQYLRSSGSGSWAIGAIQAADLPIAQPTNSATALAGGQCVATASCPVPGQAVLATQCHLTSGSANLQDAWGGTCTFNCSADCACQVMTTCVGP